MGTVQGFLDYQPPSRFVVGEGDAFLSAPAFGLLKVPQLVVKGLIGFHYPYNPKSMRTSFSMKLWINKYVLDQDTEFLDPITDLPETTPSRFFCWSGIAGLDRKYLTTNEIRAAGFDAFAAVADLKDRNRAERPAVSRFGRAKKKNSIPKAKNRKPTERKEQGR